MCIAAAAGSYALCQRSGLSLPLGLGVQSRHAMPHARTITWPAASVATGDRSASRAARLSDVAQTQREFGSKIASTATARAMAIGLSTMPGQASTTEAQETSEFGFER
jgi:hypothetical protein